MDENQLRALKKKHLESKGLSSTDLRKDFKIAKKKIYLFYARNLENFQLIYVACKAKENKTAFCNFETVQI